MELYSNITGAEYDYAMADLHEICRSSVLKRYIQVNGVTSTLSSPAWLTKDHQPQHLDAYIMDLDNEKC